MRRTRENELSYIDGIIRGVGEKMWRGRRKGDGSIGKVIGDKEGGIVGMLADSLVPIHPCLLDPSVVFLPDQIHHPF